MSAQSFQSSLASLFAGLKSPQLPTKWTRRYVQDMIDRSDKRIAVLADRINGVTVGRVMPDRDQVTIGSGKHFQLSILFLDICGFSARPNWTIEEQRNMLAMMNLFMAEMLNIVRDFGGTYEKNTGDGLMAYFGDGCSNDAERVKPAVEAAVAMHYFNDQLLTPWLRSRSVEPLSFRVGIDVGPVTIARVGLRGDESSIVAIGTSANIACKLMNCIPNGGICIGDNVYRNLPRDWDTTCRQCDQPSGFEYVQSRVPYPAWELNHRLTAPAV